jgi:hypothetical protein
VRGTSFQRKQFSRKEVVIIKNEYKVEGDYIFIELKRSNNQPSLYTVIDKEDIEVADSFPNTWIARYSKMTKTFYVHGLLTVGPYKRKAVCLHRLITNAGDGFVVDHLNHDTLDNRKANLRNATYAENGLNQKYLCDRNKSSGITGVTFDKKSGKWMARIGINYKRKFLGLFETKEEAGDAVTKARLEHVTYLKEASE